MGILLGSNQSLEASWIDSYFPKDLPPEWRYIYYANDYPIVMLDDSIWHQNVYLIDIDWPVDLHLVFHVTKDFFDSTDCCERLQQLANLGPGLILLSPDASICHSLSKTGFKCLEWVEIEPGEYWSPGRMADVTKIRSWRDKGETLRQVREKFEKYHRNDTDTWVFLDSTPTRLGQIKVMLDLMGISA